MPEPSQDFELQRTGQPRPIKDRRGERSVTLVFETFSVFSAVRLASGARSLTWVFQTSSDFSAVRLASGERSLTWMPQTINDCSAVRSASGERSIKSSFLSPRFRVLHSCQFSPSHSYHSLARDRDFNHASSLI